MPWNRVLDLMAPITHDSSDTRRIPEFKLGLVLKLARMSALWNVIVERIYVMLCFRRACMGELAYK